MTTLPPVKQAIFTQEQMDRVVDDLKLRTRETNAKTKRFVSDSEWLTIDQVYEQTLSLVVSLLVA